VPIWPPYIVTSLFLASVSAVFASASGLRIDVDVDVDVAVAVDAADVAAAFCLIQHVTSDQSRQLSSGVFDNRRNDAHRNCRISLGA